MSEMYSETTVTVLPELERMLVAQASRRAGEATATALEGSPIPATSPVRGAPVAPTGRVVAPERQPAGRRRSRRRPLRTQRRSTALALLAALVVGSAVAAVGPWSPLIGNEQAGHPTISRTPPSAAALRLLGVLRRAQTPRDRGVQVRAVLRIVGPQLHGVEEGWIRNLEPSVAGGAVTLVPVEAYGEAGAAQQQRQRPAARRAAGLLCVVYPFRGPAPDASLNCWSTAQIERGGALGRARGERGSRLFGLVPDGVASVTVEHANGTGTTVAVQGGNNFFDAPEPEGLSRVRSIRWRDAHGREIGPSLLGAARGSGRGSP